MIKVFSTKTDYNDYTDNSTNLQSGVMYYVLEDDSAHFITNNIDGEMKQYDVVIATDHYRNQYCTIEALQDGVLSTENEVKDFNYSIDNGTTWTQLLKNTPVQVSAGTKILLKGTNHEKFGTGNEPIQFSGNFNIFGNLASLSNGDNFRTDNTYYPVSLADIFSKNDTLISIKNLIIETEYLPFAALNDAFKNCHNLIDTPKFNIKKVGMNCFGFMFDGCTSLINGADLSSITEWVDDWDTSIGAYSRTSGAFCGMFQNCSNLKSCPKLPALAQNGCYTAMFQNCSSLTKAPELPATELGESAYFHTFNNCSSLTTAPELPATTLNRECYLQMFQGCLSLTKAPELPATNLIYRCYRQMFQNCSNLTTAPELPATELAESCYQGMFQGCTNLTNTPLLRAQTLVPYCYQAMFDKCANIKSVKAHFTEMTGSNQIKAWLRDVGTTGTVYLKYGVEIPTDSIDGVPEGWKVERF